MDKSTQETVSDTINTLNDTFDNTSRAIKRIGLDESTRELIRECVSWKTCAKICGTISAIFCIAVCVTLVCVFIFLLALQRAGIM